MEKKLIRTHRDLAGRVPRMWKYTMFNHKLRQNAPFRNQVFCTTSRERQLFQARSLARILPIQRKTWFLVEQHAISRFSSALIKFR